MLKPGIEETLCCGCEACAQVCPTDALDMSEGYGGCLYPKLDEAKCIDCGLCAKVCPMKEENYSRLTFNRAEESIAAVHKTAEIRNPSSSGGAFTAIAQAFCKNAEFKIFGAEMLPDFSVRHRGVSTIEEIGAFRKSKYVPSHIGDSFREAKRALTKGEKVLFTGTPCQIAGLKLFLRKSYDNLLAVDFSCHGVGLPDTFLRYLRETGEKFGSKVVAYDFRFKARSLSDYSCVSSRFKFENSKTLVRYKDPWFKAFVSALFKRPACLHCPFTGIKRISDITIADYWGVERISKNMTSGQGVSLILPNTQKGRDLLPELGKYMDIESFATEECQRFNMPLAQKVEYNPKSEIFKAALKNSTVEEAVEKALGKTPTLKNFNEHFLRIFPIRPRLKLIACTKKLTGATKKLLMLLPAPIRAKIFKRWAAANGRQYSDDK